MQVALGVSAVGTISWAPDKEVVFTGARLGNVGIGTLFATISTVPALSAAAASILDPAYSIFYSLNSSAGGQDTVKIPIHAGEKIFIAFSAAGWAILYFDDVIS